MVATTLIVASEDRGPRIDRNAERSFLEDPTIILSLRGSKRVCTSFIIRDRVSVRDPERAM